VAAEFRYDLPASDLFDGLSVRTSYAAGSLVPCGHLWKVYACAVFSVGAIQGEVVGATPSRQTTLHVLLGPRAGISIPLVPWLALDGHIDASFAPTRTTFGVGSLEPWSTPPFSGLLAFGLLGRFP
jgi:hypothetical protein